MQPPARRDLWMKVERDGPKRRDTTQDTGNPDLEFLLMHIPTEYRRSFFLWTNCRLQQRHSHFLLSFFHLEYEWISAAYSMIHTIHSLHLINIYRNCILSWLSGWVYGRDEFCVTTATTRLRTPPCSTTQTSPGIVQRKGKWRRRRDATHNPPFWCFYGLACSVICRGTHTLTTERETKISASDMGAAASLLLRLHSIRQNVYCTIQVHFTYHQAS